MRVLRPRRPRAAHKLLATVHGSTRSFLLEKFHPRHNEFAREAQSAAHVEYSDAEKHYRPIPGTEFHILTEPGDVRANKLYGNEDGSEEIPNFTEEEMCRDRVTTFEEATSELISLYKIMGACGYQEGIMQHLSYTFHDHDAELTGIPRRITLTLAMGVHWTEAARQYLVGMDTDTGEVILGDRMPELTGQNIHLAIARKRKDLGLVLHTHTPYVTALSCLEEPHDTVTMTSQNACMFYNSVVYDREYSGLAVNMDEGDRCCELLGDDKTVLMLCNHGSVVVAPTIAIGFERLFYLEESARVQLLANQSGHKLRQIQDSVAREAFEQHEYYMHFNANHHFESRKRRLKTSKREEIENLL